MPRVSGHKEIHTLYSPAHRKKEFPTADWSFLIHAAMNCAIAFDVIHRGGHAIGDVNQSNVLVSAKATVRLIDCDSFQINAGGHCFPCVVGVPLYTPPELQGQSFRGVIRTHNHDRFGLAVLIFHLLFVGRHPFSGRPLTRGDLPIEKAIKEFRFAYSRFATQLQIAPPLHAPLLDIVPAEFARLFERAFSLQSPKPGERPTAQEWVTGLNALQKQLKACPSDPGHKFSSHLPHCCWCALMKTGAPNFFVSVSVFRPGTTVPSLSFVLGSTWGEIDRVPRPTAIYLRPAVLASARIAPTALPANIPSRVPPLAVVPREFLHRVVGWTAAGGAIALSAIVLFAVVLAIGAATSRTSAFPGYGSLGFGTVALVVAVSFGIWWLVLELMHQGVVRSANAERQTVLADLRKERDRRRSSFQSARQELEEAENEWLQRARGYEQTFDALKRSLDGLRHDFLNLKNQYEREYKDLERNKEAAQLAQFLQAQFISDHEIPGIGPTREAVLRSNGIETAYDIEQDRILAIAGFGPVLTNALLSWKQEVSRRFRFNATADVSPNELAALAMKYRQIQQRIENKMQTALGELRGCSETAERHLSRIGARILGLVVRLEQAKLDLHVLPGRDN